MNEHQSQTRAISEEERVRQLVEAVKGPSPEAQWQPKDRLPAELRARLDAARIQAHHKAESLRREYAAARELSDSLEHLDQYGEPVAIEKKLEALNAKPDPIKSKNFLGKRRELVQGIRRNVAFIAEAEKHLEHLKVQIPDELDTISQAARRVREGKEQLAAKIATLESHDREFSEFEKSFIDEHGAAVERVKQVFTEADAAIKQYAAGYRGEAKSTRADIEAARLIAKPPVKGLLFGFVGGKK